MLNNIILGDCRLLLPSLENNSIDLFLSDIPYGISFDAWDIFYNNTNSALLGQSPAQKKGSIFKRRGKPINGWANDDRELGQKYQDWCKQWCQYLPQKIKTGASLFIFGGRRTIHRVVNAFENEGFILKDMLAWQKLKACYRAQRLSLIYSHRGLENEAKKWEGWRLGNLSPIYEPIAWFIKPYKIGSTIADNVLTNSLGAMRKIEGNLTNILKFGFNESRFHEAQKPLALIEFLIKLVTIEGQTVLDPFMGSGTTAVACRNLNRNFVGFEINPEFHKISLERLKCS